jgi:hypothetical protein
MHGLGHVSYSSDGGQIAPQFRDPVPWRVSAASIWEPGYVLRGSPGGVGFLGICVSSSAIVAVGGSVCVTGDLNATTWTPRTIAAGTYRAAAASGSTVVAVGDGVAASSTDNGATWTTRAIPAGVYRAVMQVGAGFCAVGDNVCATSPDGATWTSRTIPAGTYYGIAQLGSLLCAVGGGNSGATSSDGGATWVSHLTPAINPRSIAASSTAFCIYGSAGAGAISTDGATWISSSLPALAAGKTFADIAVPGRTFVAVSSDATVALLSRDLDCSAWLAAQVAVMPMVFVNGSIETSVTLGNFGATAWTGKVLVAAAGGSDSGVLVSGFIPGVLWNA